MIWNIIWSGKASEEGTFELDLAGCIGVLYIQRDKRRKGVSRGTNMCQSVEEKSLVVLPQPVVFPLFNGSQAHLVARPGFCEAQGQLFYV